MVNPFIRSSTNPSALFGGKGGGLSFFRSLAALDPTTDYGTTGLPGSWCLSVRGSSTVMMVPTGGADSPAPASSTHLIALAREGEVGSQRSKPSSSTLLLHYDSVWEIPLSPPSPPAALLPPGVIHYPLSSIIHAPTLEGATHALMDGGIFAPVVTALLENVGGSGGMGGGGSAGCHSALHWGSPWRWRSHSRVLRCVSSQNRLKRRGWWPTPPS